MLQKLNITLQLNVLKRTHRELSRNDIFFVKTSRCFCDFKNYI